MLFFSTDFYIESEPGQKLGFLPGVAESLVRANFQKWQNQMSNKKNEPISCSITESSTQYNKNQEVAKKLSEKAPKVAQFPESYNGAVRDNYSWSQTISDIDVLINVPTAIFSAKDLKVDITSENVSISVNTNCLIDSNLAGEHISSKKSSKWTNIFNGKLSFKTRKEESLWSLIPGQHISVSTLTKIKFTFLL